jgi:hypothetical protein
VRAIARRLERLEALNTKSETPFSMTINFVAPNGEITGSLVLGEPESASEDSEGTRNPKHDAKPRGDFGTQNRDRAAMSA